MEIPRIKIPSLEAFRIVNSGDLGINTSQLSARNIDRATWIFNKLWRNDSKRVSMVNEASRDIAFRASLSLSYLTDASVGFLILVRRMAIQDLTVPMDLISFEEFQFDRRRGRVGMFRDPVIATQVEETLLGINQRWIDNNDAPKFFDRDHATVYQALWSSLRSRQMSEG